MNELEIISNIRKIIKNPSALNINDDVFFDKKNKLVVSIDTYNEKIHFLNFNKPELIIKKVLRSSISDIISKGVDPKYVFISYSGTKKTLNKKKLISFLKSIKQEQAKYNFSLVGGDTTSSNKTSFTICVLGYSKKIITRGFCKVKDDIYITGNIGDSSIGLNILKKKIRTQPKIKNYFIQKYYKPNIPFGFHKELLKFANSSMDVSDGLLIDLKKILVNSKLRFIIDYDLLPTSIYFNSLKKNKKNINKYLFHGDDYQILFTAKPKFRSMIHKYSLKWNQKVTRIGTIVNHDHNYLKFNKKLNKIKDYHGYIHDFS